MIFCQKSENSGKYKRYLLKKFFVGDIGRVEESGELTIEADKILCIFTALGFILQDN